MPPSASPDSFKVSRLVNRLDALRLVMSVLLRRGSAVALDDAV
jgi:hypothetical protein